MKSLLSLKIKVSHQSSKLLQNKKLDTEGALAVLPLEVAKDTEKLRAWIEVNVLREVWNKAEQLDKKNWNQKTPYEKVKLDHPPKCLFIPELCYHSVINDACSSMVPPPELIKRPGQLPFVKKPKNNVGTILLPEMGDNVVLCVFCSVIWNYQPRTTDSLLILDLYGYATPTAILRFTKTNNDCYSHTPVPRVRIRLEVLQLELSHLVDYARHMIYVGEEYNDKLDEPFDEPNSDEEDENEEKQEREREKVIEVQKSYQDESQSELNQNLDMENQPIIYYEEEDNEIVIPEIPKAETMEVESEEEEDEIEEPTKVLTEEEREEMREEFYKSLRGLSLDDESRQHQGSEMFYVLCDGKILHSYSQRITKDEIDKRCKSRLEVIYSLYMGNNSMKKYMNNFLSFNKKDYLHLDEVTQSLLAAALCHKKPWIRLFVEGEMCLLECVMEKIQTRNQILSLLSHTDEELLKTYLGLNYKKRIKKLPETGQPAHVFPHSLRDCIRRMVHDKLSELIGSWIKLFQVFQSKKPTTAQEDEVEEIEYDSEDENDPDSANSFGKGTSKSPNAGSGDWWNMSMDGVEEEQAVGSGKGWTQKMVNGRNVSIPINSRVMSQGLDLSPFLQDLFVRIWSFLKEERLDVDDEDADD